MWLINKRNVILMLVIAILISACIIAVTTYNSNTIVCLASIEVVSTNQALLALEPGSDPTGNMIEEKEGILYFNFSFDKNIEQYYLFTELFKVRNNSVDDIIFSVESEGIDYISIMPSDIGIAFVEDGVNTGYYHSLPSGASVNVAVSFNIPSCPETPDIYGRLLIKAQAVD